MVANNAQQSVNLADTLRNCPGISGCFHDDSAHCPILHESWAHQDHSSHISHLTSLGRDCPETLIIILQNKFRYSFCMRRDRLPTILRNDDAIAYLRTKRIHSDGAIYCEHHARLQYRFIPCH